MTGHDVVFALLVLAGLVCACAQQLPDHYLHRVQLPEGFSISVYARGIPNARSLAMSPSGTLFVGSMNFDQDTRVYAVPFPNCTIADANCTASTVVPVTEPLTMPNGVEFYNGDLYVALIDRVLRYRNIEANLTSPPAPEVFLPPGTLADKIWHGWRYIRTSPDGDALLITSGSPCNIPCDGDCDCADLVAHPYYGSILRLPFSGGAPSVVARGIRNSVGMTVHPLTRELWFTDNGRDNWDPGHADRPPDELNRVAGGAVQHYGFPYCYGVDLVDPTFNTWGSCANMTGAAVPLGAHVAGLGVRFYDRTDLPSWLYGRAVLAEHGSWDRQPPAGYRLTAVHPADPSSYAVLLDGFLTLDTCDTDADCPGLASCQNDNSTYQAPYYCGGWARPVDVQVLPDGSLAVSDDLNGVVYRLAYSPVPWWRSLGFYVGAGAAAVVLLGVVLTLLGRCLYKRAKYQRVADA